jgi:hypothetical protein
MCTDGRTERGILIRAPEEFSKHQETCYLTRCVPYLWQEGVLKTRVSEDLSHLMKGTGVPGVMYLFPV